MKKHTLTGASFGALAIALGVTAPTVASAQDDTIVVTGSAIKGTPEDAALPVDVFTAEDLELEGSPSALDFAKELTISGPTLGETNYFIGGNLSGSPVFNLRGLGEGRTLTLLNGRRMSENLANIPAIAVERTEVLKDGAAVIYGADAIAGVVNFITREGFTGLETKGSYKLVQDTDGEWDLGILGGWGSDDVNFLWSAEWEHRSQLETEDRSFSSLPYAQNAAGSSFLTNLTGYFPASGTTPIAGAISDFTQAGCEEQGGVFQAASAALPTPSCIYDFRPFYNLVEDQDIYRLYGQIDARVNDNMDFHLDAAYGQVKIEHQSNSPSLPTLRGPRADRNGASLQYIVPASNPFVADFLAQNNSTGVFPVAPGVSIPASNYIAFLTRPFAHQGNPALSRGDGNTNAAEIDNQIFRISAGIDGTLGDFFGPLSDVSYDVAATYNNSQSFYRDADVLGFRLQEALNGFGGPNCNAADLDPNTLGTQNAAAAGVGDCLFFNPFSSSYAGNPELGTTNPNYIQGNENPDELVQWLFDPLAIETHTQSVTLDAVFSGMSGIELPGGEIGWALGAQSRQIETREFIESNFYNGSVPCPYPGQLDCGENPQDIGPLTFRSTNEPEKLDQQIWSVFGEVSLPLTDALNMQAAVRHEEFSGGFNNTVYKLSGKYQVMEPLALRASYGTNFVAPPVGLSPGEVNNFVRRYDVTGTYLGASALTRNDITPEEATVWNVGAIWQSAGFKPEHYFNLTLDYFDIETYGEIGELANPDDLADLIFASGTADCSSPLIDRFTFNDDGNGNTSCIPGTVAPSRLANVRTDVGNGPDVYTAGLDFSVAYNMPVGAADMTLGMTGTRLFEYEVGPQILDGVEVKGAEDRLGNVNFASVVRAVPEWRVNAFLNYNRDIHNLRITGRYTSSLDDARGTRTPAGFQPGTTTPFDTLDISEVDSYLTFDASYVVDLSEDLRISATVDNIADEDPPFVYSEFGYDPRFASPLGRTFEVSIKKNW